MKNFFTLILICLAGALSAQTFEYSTSMHPRDKYENQNFIACEIYFKTKQPETITFQFKVLQSTFPSNWNFSLCGYGTCYVGIPNGGEFLSITQQEMEEGKEAFFKLNINPKSFDSGYVQIYVYEKGNFNRGDTVSMKVINLEQLSVEIVDNDQFNVYPNPAEDILYIDFETNSPQFNASLKDAMGKEVLAMDGLYSTEPQSMDVSALSSGIYYLHLTTENGVEVKKVMVQ